MAIGEDELVEAVVLEDIVAPAAPEKNARMVLEPFGMRILSK